MHHNLVAVGADAEAVAPDEQPLSPHVPERKREHAVEMANEGIAVLCVQAQDHLTVRTGPETVTFGLEHLAQFAEIVDLAVAHDPKRTVRAGQRLMTSGQVDDRQATHSDGARAVRVHPLVVGTAMDRDPTHGGEWVRIDGLTVQSANTEDAAHCALVSSRSARLNYALRG